MRQIHLRDAAPGDYAPIVLLPGDPGRTQRIASRFDGGLAKAKQVNANRGLLGFTGTFKGVPVRYVCVLHCCYGGRMVGLW